MEGRKGEELTIKRREMGRVEKKKKKRRRKR